MRPAKSKLLSLTFLSLALPCQSQTADSFNPGISGSPAMVYAFGLQPDGRILVGGSFTSLAKTNRYYVGRVTADGLPDTEFNAMDSSGSNITCISIQADGSIFVGGKFQSICGQARSHITRLHPDGNLDAVFGASADGVVNAIAVQADGTVLVGGGFAHLDGQSSTYLGRLEPDGTVDTNFNASLDGPVNSIAVQPNGAVLIGGSFTNVDGRATGQLSRLNTDGSLDTNFAAAVAGGPVYAVAMQADGKILVGGFFKTLNGQNEPYLGRLNPDGSLDTPFNPACNGTVYSIALQADGKILIGGGFSSFEGQSVTNLVRLNSDGTLDGTFNTSSGLTYALGLQQDGKLLVGGVFSKLAGQSRNDIGRLNNTDPATQSLSYDGSTVTWVRGGTSPEVWRTTFEALTDGTNWVSLGAGTRIAGGWQLTGVSLATNVNIRATGIVVGGYANASSWPVEAIMGPPLLTAQPDTQVVSTGKTAVFSVTAAGTPPLIYQWQMNGTNLPGATESSLTLTNVGAGSVGSYDVVLSNSMGTTVSTISDLALATPVGADSFAPTVLGLIVRTLAVQPDTKVLLASSSSIGGGSAAYLVRVNPDGGTDSSFYSSIQGANNLITALAVQEDLQILVGGYFSTFNGQPCASLCRLGSNGTLDTSFTASTDGQVYCLALQADGKILIGGTFANVDGLPHTNIARLNANGTLDPGFNATARGTVYCLALQSDNSIVVGGSVWALDGQSVAGLGRLFSNGSLDTTFKPNLAPAVYAVAVQADGKIVIGGNFGGFSQWADNIGRLNPNGTVDTTFSPGADSLVTTLALQEDGRIVAGGSFFTLAGQSTRYLGRLNADGTLDSTFNLAPSAPVQCSTLQSDGKILIGGGFTTLGNQSRRYIGRLNNSEPANQTLALAASQLIWDRTGTAPEIWRASFEASTNGVDWLYLGDGTRVPNGWALSAPAIPPGASVRARGFVLNSGISGSFLEHSLFQQALAILTTDGNLGVRSAGFGFNVVGSPGQPVVVQASTDFINWAPLQTNSIASVPLHFSDPFWTNFPVRLYRVISP